MGKPYSIDLRERVVAAVLTGGLSRHRAAAQFGVAVSTVVNWVQRYQDTGSVAPRQMGGRKPKAICGNHHVFLVRRSANEGSRCVAGCANWPNTASRSTFARCRTSSTPKGSASKKNRHR